MMSDWTDDAGRLSAIAAHQDREAFRELFVSWAPRIKAYALRGGFHDGAADELVQDVMLRVWRKAGAYNPQRASVATWIFTIARNAKVDSWRRSGRIQLDTDDPALVPAEPIAADDVVLAKQRAFRVRQALADLPEPQAKVLNDAYFEHKSLAAIAEEQSLALGTVKSRVRLAFARLRGTLVEER